MKRITSYPFLLGLLIGILLCVAVFAITVWAPWMWDALGPHRRLAEAVLFTAWLFAGCVYFFWPWHRRSARAFWGSLCIFFLLHILGVFIYSTRVGPILLWHWMILLPLETYAAAFLVGLSTWHFGMRRNLDAS